MTDPSHPPSPDAVPLLDVVNLRVGFGSLTVVDGVSFTLHSGEVPGIVGESGCGKTTMGRLVLRLIEPTSGAVRFDGQDLLGLDAAGMRAMRRQLQIVFQDPMGALNPRMTRWRPDHRAAGDSRHRRHADATAPVAGVAGAGRVGRLSRWPVPA